MPRRARNPLIPFHEQDREAMLDVIQRVCGCASRTAGKLYAAYPRGVGLDTATQADLRALGLTPTQAKRFHGAFELARRVQEADLLKEGQIGQPSQAVAFVRAHLPHAEQEQFVVMFLDARQQVLDARVVAVGTLANVDVHPREIFRDAIRMRAHSVLLAHNHPSQDPTPSPADYELTERLVAVGKLVGIPVLDHLVVARGDAVSLASLGHI